MSAPTRSIAEVLAPGPVDRRASRSSARRTRCRSPRSARGRHPRARGDVALALRRSARIEQIAQRACRSRRRRRHGRARGGLSRGARRRRAVRREPRLHRRRCTRRPSLPAFRGCRPSRRRPKCWSRSSRLMRFLKFFPAASAGGVERCAHLPPCSRSVAFCPTGGITASTRRAYLAVPNVACVGGTWVAPRAAIDAAGMAQDTRACVRGCGPAARPSDGSGTGAA